MVRLHVTNLNQFSALLTSGATKLAKEVHKDLSKDAEKFFRGVAGSVGRSSEYQDLKFNENLRGKLGLATKALRTGGDTDAEDLLNLLRKLKISHRKTAGRNVVRFSLPTLQFLEKKLTHRFTKVDKGSIKSGPTHSWFRWWEFGDRGEITSLIILRQTIAKLVSRTSKRKKSKTALLQILKERSRSGSAIQITNRSPDHNSSIAGTHRIGTTYSNFARIFPARMGKSLKRFVQKNGGRAERLFARRSG